MPSLLALRAFESVARLGSMKKASEELHVTAGAISQLVKKLEEQLDCSLVTRVNRGFELTDSGIKLSAGLRYAFIQMREAVDSVGPADNSHEIHVTCGPPFSAKWLVPRLPEFLAEHPDIDIRINSSFDLIDYSAKEIDLGIRLTNDDDRSLDHIWLGQETMFAMASPEFIAKHKIEKPKDIMGLPLLFEDTSGHFSHAPSWSDWFDMAGLSNDNPKHGIDFGENVEQALDAAVAGTGLVLGRKVLASRDLEQGRLQCLFDYQLDTGFHYQIVFKKDARLKDDADKLKQWLVSELTKSLDLPTSCKLKNTF